ncbi:N,N-dimethylformamidase large subunit [Rhodophyticola sp. CCM32]|uniref:N,N-dimethylformamidase beta subunit family domain-containing protein n=1 Tax=Rhodophyticola sp. CCM32 TaxID=2916397 RepID=UPI00107F3B55|nr:N,N-dimethylformamidase beta subunit family domain-containing protein [Rhodophyticola sp. CCM32]QBY02250.1 N,N-dimethylformamidase large subunit [Rhodophyticola sp. CCM32]
MKNIPLIGYTDRLSVRPGETIAFKVSSAATEAYSAHLVRSISADPNPAGCGIVEEDASAYFTPARFPSREQAFQAGSYGVAHAQLTAEAGQEIKLSAIVFPTKRDDGDQVVLACGAMEMLITPGGGAGFRFGRALAVTDQPLTLRRWYRLIGSLGRDGHLTIRQEPLGRSFEDACEGYVRSGQTTAPGLSGHPSVAARIGQTGPSGHFNGKLEAPEIQVDGQICAAWDFSQDIHSTTARATTGPDMALINHPARAMTGSRWDGSEMCWRHKPEHYGAIHFHDDDIYDFEWKTDFTFTLPDDMPSGIYVMRLAAGGHEDAIPFFVCAPRGKPRAKLCVLVSTFTYTIYGNHARPDYDPSWQTRMADWKAYPHNPAEYPQYGLSTYNYHSDGSGICHASHRRPLLNLRPGYLTFGDTPCSGLRHLPADSHLISWLHARNIDYDLITDHELHCEGVDAITGYAALTTASHPEYHTGETLDALRDFRDCGGALHYLGGNGFYWRIARHQEDDGLLEIRRAEDGIRAWAAEPGEYYNAFDGSYGGLWRRNARAPQELVGIGFAAQGEFSGAPYQRVCNDPHFDWVFQGIDDDILGAFGFSGNGAAGYELDHCDTRLGTPETVTILARSITHDGAFMLVPEEQLTHLTNLSGGPAGDVMHADMIYFDVPGGGSVFSTGSITFCGSLPWNNFDNNISRLLENVLRRSL